MAFEAKTYLAAGYNQAWVDFILRWQEETGDDVFIPHDEVPHCNKEATVLWGFSWTVCASLPVPEQFWDHIDDFEQSGLLPLLMKMFPTPQVAIEDFHKLKTLAWYAREAQ